jgi:hypothetical protein
MISEIDMEMARAKAMVTGVAVLLALALTNPSPQDYELWSRTPEASRVNLVVASLYDGDVIGVASLFFKL